MKSVLFRNLVLLIIVMLWGRVRRQYEILVWCLCVWFCDGRSIKEVAYREGASPEVTLLWRGEDFMTSTSTRWRWTYRLAFLPCKCDVTRFPFQGLLPVITGITSFPSPSLGVPGVHVNIRLCYKLLQTSDIHLEGVTWETSWRHCLLKNGLYCVK